MISAITAATIKMPVHTPALKIPAIAEHPVAPIMIISKAKIRT
jgi:hypothetical protein